MQEAEHFRDIRCRRLADLHLPHAVAEAARAARDTLQAQAPRTRTGPVVLCGEALIPLFEAYTSQASAGTAYMKLSRFDVGQSVYGDQPPTGERLTLRANALRPFGLASHRFAADGVPGQDVLLIEDGVLRARHATQRYAQYLGIPATGEPGDTEVGTGATALAGLLEGESVYQVVGFSAPDVDSHHGGLRLRDPPGVRGHPPGAAPDQGGLRQRERVRGLQGGPLLPRGAAAGGVRRAGRGALRVPARLRRRLASCLRRAGGMPSAPHLSCGQGRRASRARQMRAGRAGPA